jgi:uncharacterized protein YciI
MVEYYFVELIRNPDKPQIDSTQVMEIQAAHMENMGTMVKNGQLLCAGPFGDGNGGGIWILKVNSYNEAEELCKSDPAIKNDRLKYKIRSWWTSEGTFTLENKTQ